MPITTLRRYYEWIRPTCVHLYFRPCRFCGLRLFDWHHAYGSQVARNRLMCAPAVSTPPREQATCRFVSALVPEEEKSLVLRGYSPFDFSSMVHLRSASHTLPDLFSAFSCAAHYHPLKVRQSTGGLAGAPVASRRTGHRGQCFFCSSIDYVPSWHTCP